VSEINPSSAVAQRHQPHQETDARDDLAPVHQSLRHEAWPMVSLSVTKRNRTTATSSQCNFHCDWPRDERKASPGDAWSPSALVTFDVYLYIFRPCRSSSGQSSKRLTNRMRRKEKGDSQVG
jgi:hypothetical protein